MVNAAILTEPQSECKERPLDRLDQILAQLPDAERAECWRGVALDLAARLRQRETVRDEGCRG